MSTPVKNSGESQLPLPQLNEEQTNVSILSSSIQPVINFFKSYFKETQQTNLTKKDQEDLVDVLDEVASQPRCRTIFRPDDENQASRILFITPLVTHSLMDSSSLGIFLEKCGKYASSGNAIETGVHLSQGIVFCALNHLKNRKDVVDEKYRQLWEKYSSLFRSTTPPKYEPPNNKNFSPSCQLTYLDHRMSSKEVEMHLSYQKRFLERAIEVMYVDGKPYNPAFERIFVPSEKSEIMESKSFTPEELLKSQAIEDLVVYEYKIDRVPEVEVDAYLKEADTRSKSGHDPMPVYSVRELSQRIEASLKERPIRMVDLHKISHLLKKLGHYESSSACVEQEWLIDGKERPCTMIILRNVQDLVKERYDELYESHKPETYNPPIISKKKNITPLKRESLSLQKELLEKSVEAMHIDAQPFDPLFDRIDLLSDDDRIKAGYPLLDIAKRDIIRFVYRQPESGIFPEYTVDAICTRIETIMDHVSKNVSLNKS